jgi:flagellar biosynthesis protein FlhF
VEIDMKIKRYTAVSMREALAQVRAEQGPDAVILSSRRGEDGIEVIAAVDYDEALFVEARQRSPAASPEAPTPAAAVPSEPIIAPRAPARAQAPLAPTLTAASTQRLIPSSFRRLTVSSPPAAALPRVSAPPARPDLDLGANDQRLSEPLRARVFEELTAMDIAPDMAMALAALTPQRTSLDNRSLISLALLVRHLPVVDPLTGVDSVSGISGGIMAVVGPTGAGKTTTIAKLAARWCKHHGSQDLALVSTDGYRIGAREQLMTYSRILGVPMYAANSGMELARALERLKSKKLILIDTAGMGPRDVRLTEQLAALQLGAARARVMLALPAQGEGHALEEIVQAFARLAPSACILTKVDEAASLGAVISTTLRHKLKIAYICDGQRVPEDLHAAHQKRVWLVRAALNLKSDAPPHDKAHHARTVGRARAHV